MNYRKIKEDKLSDYMIVDIIEKKRAILEWLKKIVKHVSTTEKYITRAEDKVKMGYSGMALTSIYYHDENFPLPEVCVALDVKHFSDNKLNKSVNGYYFPMTEGFFIGWIFVCRYMEDRIDILLTNSGAPSALCPECHVSKDTCGHKACIIC
jgi:hypothetical protein